MLKVNDDFCLRKSLIVLFNCSRQNLNICLGDKKPLPNIVSNFLLFVIQLFDKFCQILSCSSSRVLLLTKKSTSSRADFRLTFKCIALLQWLDLTDSFYEFLICRSNNLIVCLFLCDHIVSRSVLIKHEERWWLFNFGELC